MKTFVVFLCIVPLAFIQAASVVETPQQIKTKALKHCIDAQKADETKITELFKQDYLPEDDLKFADFFVCYWTQAKIINEDGSFNKFAIQGFYPYFITEEFPKISDEASQKLTLDAMKHCENVPKGKSLGLKGIQYLNCMVKFVLDKQI